MVADQSRPAGPRYGGTPRSRFADVARFPRLERRLREQTRKLAHDQRLTVCAHARTAAVLFACAQHPGAGLHCPRCAGAHIDRHDPDVERTCDQCGKRGDMVSGVGQRLVARGLAVRDRRGKRGVIFGEIVLGGFGVCPRCFEAKAAA